MGVMIIMAMVILTLMVMTMVILMVAVMIGPLLLHKSLFKDHSLDQDRIVQVAVLSVFGGVVLAAALPVLGLPETRGKPLLQTVNQVGEEICCGEMSLVI